MATLKLLSETCLHHAAAPGAGGTIKFAQVRGAGITGNTSSVTGGGGNPADATGSVQPAIGFTFHSDLKTFDEAEEVCKDEGGHLAYFLSEPEQDSIEKWLIDMVGGDCTATASPSSGEAPCLAGLHMQGPHRPRRSPPVRAGLHPARLHGRILDRPQGA